VYRAAVVLLAAAACAAKDLGPPRILHDDVTVVSGEARLAARISYPDDKKRHPAVVSVHGSGRLGREQTAFEWQRLAPEGIAVLTYDKRGVGDSTGEFVRVGTSTSEDYMPILAGDALECLRALRRHPSVDPDRVGFIGSSQAGWIIPVALSKAARGEAAFAIIRSGPATSVGLEMEYSRLTGDGIRQVTALAPQEIDRRLADYKGPQGLDTVPLILALRTPTLWLLGDDDESIPIRPTKLNLERAIVAGAPITVKSYAGANHGLRRADGSMVPFWDDTLVWLRARRILQ
jgi:dienelactone hydrolase